MNIYRIETNGICTYGTAIIISETEEKAKEKFNNKHFEDYDKIVSIEKIDLNKENIIYYDDGER
ncbi:UNVERIFIED_ORG: hypothetical protein B2H93_04780 [Clostridium botulinum]